MSSAANLYHSVINDVVSSVRDAFLDESVDENVLQELKQLWHTKLEASKTIDPSVGVGVAGQETKKTAVVSANTQRRIANSASGGATSSAASVGAGAAAAAGGAGAGQQQLVITDPNRLVPVQITIPAQPGNPASQPRALTVQVPAHALQQQGSSSALLQQVLTTAITQALALPESHAAVFLQTQINNTFRLNQ